MNTSTSMPVFANVPGMTAVKDSWLLRNLDGFKRVKGSRPQSAQHILARRRNESGNGSSRASSPTRDARTLRFDDTQGQPEENADFRFTYDQMINHEMDPYRVTPSPNMPQGYRVRPSTATDTARYDPRSAMGRTKKIDAGDLAAEGLTSPIKRIATLDKRLSAGPEHMQVPVQNRGNHGAIIVSATNRRPDLPYLEPTLKGADLNQDQRPLSKHRIPANEDNELLLASETHRVTSNERKREENYLVAADRKNENEARAQELMAYKDDTKLTCRFMAYFTEDRVWDTNAPIGTPVIEQTVNRHLTFEYHVFDGTWTIYERKQRNLGVEGGKFLKRGKIVKDDDNENMCLTIFDMVPGQDVHILGKKIRITGADDATHNFLEANFGFSLRGKEEVHPKVDREDLGAHYAFGFGGRTFPPRTDNTFPPTYEFYQRKEQNMKTRRFLFNDARPLRFNCIEINDRADDGAIDWSVYEKWKADGEKGPLMINNSIRMAVLTYFIPDYCLEITLGYWPNQVVKHQEDPLILKRSKIQKNWREDTSKKVEPTFYEPSDFVCGEIVDVYGRYYLLVDADEATRDRYLDMGHDHRRIEVEIEKVVPIERPIPKAGDGFLDIGQPEQTLATVYGQQKKSTADPNRERNRGRQLKCRAKLISKMPIDNTRKFSITFYMEDNHLSIFEEDVRNSGVVGGTYLSKGRHVNYLPANGGEPRYFKCCDIFLGNIISVNKVEFQITEMDGASLRFCEANPDEFPMSDTFDILMRLLDHVLDNALNVRKICKDNDPRRSGYFEKNSFVKLMDVLCLGGAADGSAAVRVARATPESSQDNMSIESERLAKLLNDQEILTVMRRFQDDDKGTYHYDEMCDIFSHFYFTRELKTPSPSWGHRVHSLDELMTAMRASKVQWRRVFRKDVSSVKGFMMADYLVEAFQKLGLTLSEMAIDELSERFAIPDEKAVKVVKVLNQKLGRATNISSTASITAMSVSTVGSMASTSSKASKSSKPTVRKGPAMTAFSTGTVKGSNLDDMSVASVTVEGRRRQLQQTLPGVMRKSQPRAKAKETVVKLDLGATVISFNALCDHVFISEWTFD